MVFFPSYRMMEDVGAVFEERCGTAFRTRYQKSGMTEDEREEFLKAFEGKGEQSLIGFCVMGGIFGEGIDLKGERLNRSYYCRDRTSAGLCGTGTLKGLLRQPGTGWLCLCLSDSRDE